METYGLIGNPVGHSLSPLIHDTFSEALSIDQEYRLYPIEDRLPERLSDLFSKGVKGLNVTVPYKSEVIPLLEGITPEAKAIGAVNTLVRKEKGFYGYNTDLEGLRRAIKEDGIKLKGEKAIVLGAGGAARAAVAMLVLEEASEITVVNRNVGKAELLVRDIRENFDNAPELSAIGLDELEKLTGSGYIAIQCTSVGLRPDTDRAVVTDRGFYSKLSYGFDAVYSPMVTRFIQLCRENGVKCSNGLKMLLYQAVAAYELWHGLSLKEDVIKMAYEKLCEGQMRNAVLIGFMGSGKSAVGRRLAAGLGYEFLDTDELIVKREGRSINEIFEVEGEDYFRDLETEVLKELSEELKNGKRFVLSVGGGLPVREKNRKYLKKLGYVIYLRAHEETLYERLKNNSERPLLKEDMKGKIHELLTAREDIYMKAADQIIDTDELSISEIVLKGERLL